MAEIVEASLTRVSLLLPDGITITREDSAEFDTVMANETQILQVLFNLYNNAVEALGTAYGRITIGLMNVAINKNTLPPIEHLLPGRYLKLSVSDTGSGIDSDILDRIFTPYFTTKDFDRGPGFGLVVVYGIIINHNGWICVSTEVGKGTIFDIYLPTVGIDRGLGSKHGS